MRRKNNPELKAMETLKGRSKDPDEGTLKVYRKILGKPGGNGMVEVEE